MKVKEVDVLIIAPTYDINSNIQPWYLRWSEKLSQATLVTDKNNNFENWQNKIIAAIESSTKPLVIIAYSLGITAFFLAATKSTKPIAGAFFVSPIQDDKINDIKLPTNKLPYPSVLIASNNAKNCSLEYAKSLASSWHSLFLDCGAAGDINALSGYGPWPEGFMVFSKFLSKL
ncbi:RBBP9/YdeN family alpha/beta hydrolase [Bartonella sp. DGB1]|uniref:RBBP9/YdeN family alpha/beta hydrolase n=1 Tax=Bartonella sp. DGB1 TaxID=3239807 RepID=UPI0035256EC7